MFWLIGFPRHLFNLRIVQNWGMSEDESIWDPICFFHAFNFSLPAALFSTHIFQQCSSHPPHSLALADRADPKLCGSSRDMQISQAPGREVFCIYLLWPQVHHILPLRHVGLLGYFLRNLSKRLCKTPCSIPGQNRDCTNTTRDAVNTNVTQWAAAPSQPSNHARLLYKIISRDHHRVVSCPLTKPGPK